MKTFAESLALEHDPNILLTSFIRVIMTAPPADGLLDFTYDNDISIRTCLLTCSYICMPIFSNEFLARNSFSKRGLPACLPSRETKKLKIIRTMQITVKSAKFHIIGRSGNLLSHSFDSASYPFLTAYNSSVWP